MSNWIQIPEVNIYLIRIKKAVSVGNYIIAERRDSYVTSLAKAGILSDQVKDYILKLTYKNYFNGPEDDKDLRFTSGECLFFGCVINGYEFYIKLKLIKNEDDETCICISFHIADKPIKYPYK